MFGWNPAEWRIHIKRESQTEQTTRLTQQGTSNVDAMVSRLEARLPGNTDRVVKRIIHQHARVEAMRP